MLTVAIDPDAFRRGLFMQGAGWLTPDEIDARQKAIVAAGEWRYRGYISDCLDRLRVGECWFVLPVVNWASVRSLCSKRSKYEFSARPRWGYNTVIRLPKPQQEPPSVLAAFGALRAGDTWRIPRHVRRSTVDAACRHYNGLLRADIDVRLVVDGKLVRCLAGRKP